MPARHPAKSSFTVMTSFVSSPSEIVAATGPWADCTDVTDLSNYANQVSPTKVQFSGEKQVGCASGDVVIHYDATMNFRSGQGLTFGSWSVVSSENPSIQGGSGTVSGVTRAGARTASSTSSRDRLLTPRPAGRSAAAAPGRPGAG